MSESPSERLKPGRVIPPSDWVTITQTMVDRFSEATLDSDPMHTSPEWARERGPFPYTVAFGFQTMSLLTHLMHDAMHEGHAVDPDVQGYYLNYGFNRLRLVEPVPVGSRIRAHFQPADQRCDDKGRTVFTVEVSVEIEGAARPALVAEWLTMWVPPDRP